MLIRYRFKTYSVSDCRPIIDMAEIKMPWWCSGWGEDGDGEYAIIICYLPDNEELEKYWDDAFDIEKEIVDKIIYTDRFSKPKWCN